MTNVDNVPCEKETHKIKLKNLKSNRYGKLIVNDNLVHLNFLYDLRFQMNWIFIIS